MSAISFDEGFANGAEKNPLANGADHPNGF
jgi:hypothetical protein